jgi:hypothetical protein
VDIIHPPVFYLKHDISETGFWLRLQVEHTQLVSIDRASHCDPETETSSISKAQLSRLHLKTRTESSLRYVVDNVQNCDCYINTPSSQTHRYQSWFTALCTSQVWAMMEIISAPNLKLILQWAWSNYVCGCSWYGISQQMACPVLSSDWLLVANTSHWTCSELQLTQRLRHLPRWLEEHSFINGLSFRINYLLDFIKGGKIQFSIAQSVSLLAAAVSEVILTLNEQK